MELLSRGAEAGTRAARQSLVWVSSEFTLQQVNPQDSSANSYSDEIQELQEHEYLILCARPPFM